MDDREWMYRRMRSGRMNPEYITGVRRFINFAYSIERNVSVGKIRCPCVKCKNQKFQKEDDVCNHLLRKGFLPYYKNWTVHGEPYDTDNMVRPSSGGISRVVNDEGDANPYRNMVVDAMRDEDGSDGREFYESREGSNMRCSEDPDCLHSIHGSNCSRSSICIKRKSFDTAIDPVSGKKELSLYGTSEFNNASCGREIGIILRNNFKGPWHSWDKVDAMCKDELFKEFKKKYAFPEEDEAIVRKIWEDKARISLNQQLARARNKAMSIIGTINIIDCLDKGPVWIQNEDWNTMINDVWSTDRFCKRSKTSKQNRLKKTDGKISTHSAGSVSFASYRASMQEQAGGKELPWDEVFSALHQKSNETGTFVDNRSKTVVEKYRNEMVARYGPDQDNHPSFDGAAWCEASGGVSKGRVYGAPRMPKSKVDTQVGFLAKLSHPNIVKLLGCCQEEENRELLIVYEFMEKGSLNYHLFGKRSGQQLPWKTRLMIATEMAEALSYLHSMDRPIIFRDFKTSNILLDESYSPRLSDFGLAKWGPNDGTPCVTGNCMGTHGYVAPECKTGGKLYVKSDVYSFGVVLIELLTGLRSVDKKRPPKQQDLREWASPFLTDRKKLRQIMDPGLQGKYSSRQALKIAMLAVRCLYSHPMIRPSMKEVAETLEQLKLRS